MKILLVSSLGKKTTGGISSWTKNYIQFCQNSNIECVLVNTEFEGKRNSNESAFIITDELKRLLRICRSIKQSLKQENVDIVHLNSSCSCLGIIRDYYIAKKIVRKYKIKLVIHFHCDIEYQIKRWKGTFSKISFFFLTKLMKLQKKCIVLSQTSHNYLLEKFHETSRIIPNFISDELLLKNDKIIKENIETVLFIGHVIKEKGLEELFSVAKVFCNMKFVLVGEVSDNTRDWLSKLNNICLLGVCNHNQVINEIDKADVFLFPSHSEGFSMALLEVMARGLPSIVTDVGANQDMVENKGGIVVPTKDIHFITKALDSLKEKEFRTRMSKWCICKVQSSYLDSSVFPQYIKYYLSRD